ncbi:hypothetical protein V5T82_14240 [Magnetovibrio sp. PR-2]|uniref:hypothetical protein n=1 Tax=Magnetovibrio sp. PR-2 TaxID=3120356 RepID=UPI002FCE0EDA
MMDVETLKYVAGGLSVLVSGLVARLYTSYRERILTLENKYVEMEKRMDTIEKELILAKEQRANGHALLEDLSKELKEHMKHEETIEAALRDDITTIKIALAKLTN